MELEVYSWQLVQVGAVQVQLGAAVDSTAAQTVSMHFKHASVMIRSDFAETLGINIRE